MITRDEDDYRIQPATDVPPDKTIAFLMTYFTGRNDVYRRHFAWWYGNYRDYIPCVAIDRRGALVGFVGGSPLLFRDHGTLLSAGTLTDLYVDPSSRGHKLGQRLLQTMADQVDVCIGGSSTPAAHAILERMGMLYIDNARRYLVVLSPRGASAISRKVGAVGPMLRLLDPLHRLWINSRTTPGLAAHSIAAREEEVFRIIADDPAFGLYHDRAWIQWRFFENPYSERHYVARHQSAAVLFRTLTDQRVRKLHVLYCTPAADQHDLDTLFGQLLRWGIDNQCDVVWTMAAADSLKALYRKYAIRSFPINNGILTVKARYVDEAMAARALQLQLMDSDFDMAYIDQETLAPSLPA